MTYCYRMFLMLVWSGGWLATLAAAQDSASSQWSVGRIFVPVEKQQSRIPNDYWPIEIKELDEKLEFLAQNRKLSQLNPPRLEQAFYLASIQRDLLTSDHSFWKLAGDGLDSPVSIGRTSLALRDAKSLPIDLRQLGSSVRFDGDGMIEVLPHVENPPVWFGFQCASDPAVKTQRFDLQLPIARISQMLVVSEAELTLASPDVVVERIDDPRTHLPAGWPNDIELRQQPRQTWWLLHLSGVSTFSIEINRAGLKENPAYLHPLTRNELLYKIDQDSIQLTAGFEFASNQNGSSIQMRLAPEFKVRSILIDGRNVPWKSIETTDSTTLLQLVNPTVTAGSYLQLQGIANRQTFLSMATNSAGDPPVSRLRLPDCRIDNALTIQGTTTIQTESGVHLQAVTRPDQSSLRFQKSVDSNDLTQSWQMQWSGLSPSCHLQLSEPAPRWSGMSLCQLQLRPNSIDALLHIKLSGKDLQSNQLSVPVLSGWVIDDFTLSGNAQAIGQEISLDADGDQEKLLVTWRDLPREFDLQLQISAHANRAAGINSIEVPNPRVMALPDPYPVGYWMIRNNPGHHLRGTTELLSMIASKRELDPWFQSIVPGEDAQIYRDLSSGIGKFVFDDASGDFAVTSATLVSLIQDKQLLHTTQWLIEPQAGTVHSVQIALPDTEVPEHWQFQFSTDEDGIIPIVNQWSESESGLRRIALSLPTTLGQPFRLVATCDKQMSEDFSATTQVNIPGILGASSIEATVMIPAGMSQVSSDGEIEFLPSITVCSEKTVRLLAPLTTSQLKSFDANWISAHVDGSKANQIRLQPLQQRNVSSWIWSEKVAHELFETGACQHRIELDIQVDSPKEIQVEVSQDWELLSVDEDDQPARRYRWLDGKLNISVNEAKRSNFEILFRSQQPGLSWVTPLRWLSPSYSIPVLQSQEWLSLPPLYELLEGRLNESRIAFSAVRFDPLNWWQLFSPAPKLGIDQKHVVRIDWQRPTSFAGTAKTLWVIHRHSLTTLLLVAMLAVAVVAWGICGNWPRLWWMLCMLSTLLIVALPSQLVELGQLLLLGCLLGGFVRLVSFVVARSIQNARGFVPKTAQPLSFLMTICTIAFAGTASAQFQLPKPSDASKKIYGIIIPYEDSIENSSDYAYIPKELRDLLLAPISAPEQKSFSPKYVSANYLLRMRQNTREVEFNVELQVLVTDISSTLLLPFPSQQLSIVGSPQLNGQSRLLGARHFELDPNDNGIIFRPEALGLSTINIQFQPVIQSLGNQKSRFISRIPVVPNATVRIIPQPRSSGLSINARGGMQRLLSGDYFAYLGGIDQLQVEWSDNNRPTTSTVSGYTSETWIRAQQDDLCVASQLTIERGQSTVSEFDMSLDPDWEPVGTVWQNAELISTTLSTTLKRRVIRIRLNDEAGSTCKIRMLLARQPTTFPTSFDVPFLSLDRVVLKSKIFWWNGDDDSPWRIEGVESLPIMNATESWDKLQLASAPKGFQLTGSTVKVKQQLTNVNSSLVESSSLHIFNSRTGLEYEASWENSNNGNNQIYLQLPADSSVTRLEFNGQTITPSYVGEQRLIVDRTNQIASLNRLKVEIELPPISGLVEQLPKIHMESLAPRQSTYQLLRGGNVQVRLESTDSGLQFSSIQASQRRSNFDNLESYVGAANVSPELLAGTTLLTRIHVSMAQLEPPKSFIQFLSYRQGGWKARVECLWDASAENLDYALFDIPAALRDSVDAGSLVCIFKPHEDPNRINLCIPIPKDNSSTQRQVEFTFALSGSTAQSISVPPILLQHGQTHRPILALPTHIDSQPIRWTNIGDRAVLESSVGQTVLDNFSLYRLPENQTKINWQTTTPSDRSASVTELVWLELTSSSQDMVAGIINYWVNPQGLPSLNLRIPGGCDILGVDCDRHQTMWTISGDQLHVPLRPNIIPVNVRIMASWKRAGRNELKFQVPQLSNASATPHTLVSCNSELGWQIKSADSVNTNSTEALTLPWAKMVTGALPAFSNLSDQQIAVWLTNWHPEQFHLSMDSIVSDLGINQGQDQPAQNAEAQNSVGKLWSAAENFQRSIAYSTTRRQASEFGRGMINWYRVGQEFTISRRDSLVEFDSPKWPLIIAIVTVGWLGFWLWPWCQGILISLFSQQPWLYWAGVALLLWWLLPVPWPSWMIAAISCWMAITHVLDFRRRKRSYGYR